LTAQRFCVHNVPGTFGLDLGTPIPLLENEELILLQAEARWFTGDKAGADADIDLVLSCSIADLTPC
jgi:hypothetical protein